MRFRAILKIVGLIFVSIVYSDAPGVAQYRLKQDFQEKSSLRSPFHYTAPHLPLQNDNFVSPYKETRPDLFTKVFHLHYALAADMAALLIDKKNRLLSDQGRVQVEPGSNSLWVIDESDYLNRVQKIIQHSDIPVKQIQIDARIVNISQEGILDLGIRLGAVNGSQHRMQDDGKDALASDQNQSDSSGASNQLHLDFGLPFEPVSSLGLTLAKLTQSTLLDMELSALESEDKAQLISNPHLIATNQKEAIIESGEEIPFQESTLSGATSVTFKKAVLRLKVLPQIMPDNRLLMLLDINQDSPSGHVINGVPAIVTKAIHTQVLVDDGQTIVLGGIYKQDTSKVVNQAPFLGDIPMIGNVFKNLHHKVHHEELLIFITPRIIASE